jgi:hypothetical protein
LLRAPAFRRKRRSSASAKSTRRQELEAQARAAADRALKTAVIGAFITAASLLIGGVGAYFGAVLG